MLHQNLFAFEMQVDSLLMSLRNSCFVKPHSWAKVHFVGGFWGPKLASVTGVGHSYLIIIQKWDKCLSSKHNIIFAGSSWSTNPDDLSCCNACTNFVLFSIALEFMGHELCRNFISTGISVPSSVTNAFLFCQYCQKINHPKQSMRFMSNELMRAQYVHVERNIECEEYLSLCIQDMMFQWQRHDIAMTKS